MRRVTVSVPATFNSLAFADEHCALAISLHNTVEITESAIGLHVTLNESEENSSHPAVQGILKVFGTHGAAPSGLQVHLEQNIPRTCGLHSDTAFLLGGMIAANTILGQRLERHTLLTIAQEFGIGAAVFLAALDGNMAIGPVGAQPFAGSIPLPTLTVIIVTRNNLEHAAANTPVGQDIRTAMLASYALQTGNLELLKNVQEQIAGQSEWVELYEFVSLSRRASWISNQGSQIAMWVSNQSRDSVFNQLTKAFPDHIHLFEISSIDRYGISISEFGNDSISQIPTPITPRKIENSSAVEKLQD